jgi:spermidine/putrescine-binding protein
MRLVQKWRRILGVAWVLGSLLWAASAPAEELRILTVQGTAPETAVETFRRMIQQKYQMDVTVTVSYWAEPGEVYTALRNREADIISCPHNVPKDADFRLIAGKLTLPVVLDNLSNYADLIPALQYADYISDDGDVYGVPYAYAPYGLAYNTAMFAQPPESWTVFWEPRYAGRYAVSSAFYELNILITALAIGVERSQLGQVEAVNTPDFQEKLQALAQNAGAMWTLADTADDLQGKALAVGWGYAFQELRNRGETWQFAQPREGTASGVGNFYDQPHVAR